MWDPGGAVILGIKIDDENPYIELLVKVEKILSTWYYRTLTLLGKILIVNTLVASFSCT